MVCCYCNNVSRVGYFKDTKLIQLKDLKIPAAAQSSEEVEAGMHVRRRVGLL